MTSPGNDDFAKVVWRELRHDCDPPFVDHDAIGVSRFGPKGHVLLRWKCPECRQHWQYEACGGWAHDEYRWEDISVPSRRWRKARGRALQARVSGRSDREGEPCPECGHRLSAYDWCPSCLAHVSGSHGQELDQ